MPKICWNRVEAQQILTAQALASDKSVFDAVHTPFQNLSMSRELADGLRGARDERALAGLLGKSELAHAFCVVKGDPGSGKSHLIRWLSFHWTNERDLVLLVPRSDGNLLGTLSHLSHAMETRDGDAGHFEGLVLQDIAEEGRARTFHSNIANSLDPDFLEKGQAAQGEFLRGAGSGWRLLFDAAETKGKWAAPLRILRILSGQAGDETDLRGRDQESAVFVLNDLVDFDRVLRREHYRPRGANAARVKNALKKAANDIASFGKDAKSEADLTQRLRLAGKDTGPNLVEALNARSNRAVRDLLGLGADTIKRAFRDFRRQIHQRSPGRRLVLLLEDMTSFQGVDDQLLEVLVDRAGDHPDEPLAPLISVVGITGGFYANTFSESSKFTGYANLQQRIDLLLDLTGGDDENSDATRELGESDARESFVGRYLRAVRQSPSALSAWSHAAEKGSVPNACSVCSEKQSCHRIFGSVNLDGEPVGLFPFSQTAIENVYDGLGRARRAGERQQTPRGLVQHVLSPVLARVEELRELPPASIEGDYLEPLKLNLRVYNVLQKSIEAPAERDRLKRLIVWWGDPESGDTTSTGGALTYAGVPRALSDALDLPWCGGEPAADADVEFVSPPITATPEPGTVETENRPTTPRVPTPATAKGPQPVARKPNRLPPGRLQSDLQRWRDGEGLSEDWGPTLRSVVDACSLSELGAEQWLVDKIFTPNNLKLEGAFRGARSTAYFVLLPDLWIVNGLQAFIATKEAPDRALHRRDMARFLRRLRPLLLEHLDSMIGTCGGARTRPAGSLAQIFFARTWLRGTGSLAGATLEQTDWMASDWRMWIEDRDESTGVPSAGRCGIWKDAMENLPNGRSQRKQQILDMVTLGKSNPVLDTADIYTAAVQLASGQAAASLDRDFHRILDELARSFARAEQARDVIARAPDLERRRLTNQLNSIVEISGDLATSEFLDRSYETVKSLNEQDPHFPARFFQKAGEIADAVAQAGLISEGFRQRLDDSLLLDEEDRKRVADLRGLDVLRWALTLDAGKTQALAEHLKRLDRLLSEIWAYLEPKLSTTSDEDPRSDDPGQVMQDGAKKLEATVAQLLNGLRSASGPNR